MLVIWTLGLFTGTFLGIRGLSVFILAPVSAFVLIVIIVAFGQPKFAYVAIGIALLQLGYVLGVACFIFGTYLLATGLRVRARLWTSHTLRAAQTAIGQRLHATMEPPQDMPAEIARLLARVAAA
jgi:hypothetical protein